MDLYVYVFMLKDSYFPFERLYVTDLLSFGYNFLMVIFLYIVMLISIIFIIHDFISHLSNFMFFMCVFYSLCLFVYDIMLTLVIFCVNPFTVSITRLFIMNVF